MKRIPLIIIAFFLLSGIAQAAGTCTATTCSEAGSTPWTAADAEYATVNHCVNTCASANDTVNIPADDATWTDRLLITKGVNLIGAGIGNTNITLTTCTEHGFLDYTPENPSLNLAFRISGISFDIQNTACSAIWLGGSLSAIPQTKIRINNNRFWSSTSTQTIAITNNGMKGVVYNNVFETRYVARHISGYQRGEGWWSLPVWGVVFGAADNAMYYEDNTMIGKPLISFSCQAGGQYSARYNNISEETDALPLFDWHGDQGDFWSCFGGEVYGNKITMANTELTARIDMRGGRFLAYGNKTNGIFQFRFRNEYTYYITPENALYSATDVVDSYVWNNREKMTTLDTAYILTDAAWVNGLAENVNFWQQNTSYNGTTERGIYCGKTLPGNCTKGDGAWITTQSCISVDPANVGAHPAIPISGTLYKCTATNTWTSYYTPYEYPHPLSGESGGGSYVVTISKSGDGTGTVSEGDDHIDCGSQCQYDYYLYDGQEVTFTATPAVGMYFSGWTGGCTGMGLTCTVEITESTTITASFTNGRKCTLGAGGGTITVGP